MKPLNPHLFPLLTGLGIGVLSLFLPLLRDLHWESAGIASLVSAYYAGHLATRPAPKIRYVTLRILSLLIGWALPLLLFTLMTGCFSIDGLAFWIFGPFPSALFGGSIGTVSRHFLSGNSRLYTWGILSILATIPLLIQFFSFPQLYFFNHIWSYWPGPIYDEIVHFDLRLAGFRLLTLLWVVVLWSLTTAFSQKRSTAIVLLGTTAILFTYLHSSEWGWIAPEERIQQQLGAFHETDHFRIFYTAGTFRENEIIDLAANHETWLSEITESLEIDPTLYRTEKIHSYIYNNPDQKKRLTGAGQTSYVPVWLTQDQLHINRRSAERVLKHELVHIVTKQFSNWFGASSSIGLVEGVAVALAPDRYPSDIHQLVAARNDRPQSEEIRSLFRFSGFYRTAGPVSYLLSGSFVHHLLEEYPVNSFKEAFRNGDLEAGYAPLTVEELVESWHRMLESIEVDPEARERSITLFRTPSIFQIPCPRVEKKRELRMEYAHTEAVIASC